MTPGILERLWPFLMWILICFLVGVLAKRKNRSPWIWGALGFPFTLLTLIILAAVPSLCPRCKRPLKDKEARDKRCPFCDTSSVSAYPSSTMVRNEQVVSQGAMLVSDPAESLRKLKGLFEGGFISQPEYQQKKQEILRRL